MLFMRRSSWGYPWRQGLFVAIWVLHGVGMGWAAEADLVCDGGVRYGKEPTGIMLEAMYTSSAARETQIHVPIAGGGTVNGLTWWGVYKGPFGVSCESPERTFAVRMYVDGGGLPGELFWSGEFIPDTTETEELYFGLSPI